ncbi:MAG: conjugal transfer protein TraG N-terminal domain-containing protein, partial [Gammaproteobacteria bacterium]
MGVSSYFEFITTLFGWILYDNLWSVLAASGLVYVPFIVIIISSIAQAKKGGDDEGSAAKQSLKNIEVDVMIGIVVMFIAAIPFSNVQLGNMQYVKPTLDCAVQNDIAAGTIPGTVTGTNTGTSYDNTLASISGQTGRIPIWWGFVHTMTKAIVSASVASIPCSGNMAAVNFRLENDHIDDPRARRELGEFMADCYMPAKSQFIRKETAGLSAADQDSIDYIGSDYFLTAPGYYNNFYAKKANPNFAFDPIRDAGFETDAPAGHPTCTQWWRDPANGIRKLLLDNIDQANRDEYVNDPNNLIQQATPGRNLSIAQRQEVLLRKFVAIKNAQNNAFGDGRLSTGYNTSISEKLNSDDSLLTKAVSFAIDGSVKAMAAYGAAQAIPGQLAAGEMLKEGAPIFLSLILMGFVSILPFLMVFSLYSLSSLMTLTMVFFGLNMFYLMWGIAFWVDNHLTTALSQGYSLGAGIF